MRYSRYEKYKESNIFWLKKVPKDWVIKPIKYLFNSLDSKRIPLSTVERGKKQGQYPYYGASGIIDYVDEYIFSEPLILIGEDGANLLMRSSPLAFIAKGKYWVNNHAHILKPINTNLIYWANLLNAIDYTIWVTGAAQPKLTIENLKSIQIPEPSAKEQKAIADFLAHETKQIDTLIAEKEKLLKLIDEKRSATIATAAIQGLNPDVEMKDSGVPVLGKIPKHWKVERAKWCYSQREERSESGDEELLTVSHLTGITPRNAKDVNMFLAESLEGYKICYKGDLVINTMWAWMGALGISKFEGLVSPSYHVYTPIEDFNQDYLDYLVRTPAFVAEITRWSKGVWSSRLRIYPDAFLNMKMIIPPLEEQNKIVEFLNKQTIRWANIEQELNKSIELLKERRSALITAAVTGKIKVPQI